MKHIIQCLRKMQSFWMLKLAVDLLQQVTACDHTWKENSMVGVPLTVTKQFALHKVTQKTCLFCLSADHSTKWAHPYLWLIPKEENKISEYMPSFVVQGCTFSSECFKGPVIQLKGSWFLLYNSVLSQLNLTYSISVYYFLRIHLDSVLPSISWPLKWLLAWFSPEICVCDLQFPQ
jgi:hypothetical protein